MSEYKNSRPLDRSGIPQPVFDRCPSWVDFYWLAWEQAWDHVIENLAAPQSPYLDEGFSRHCIWIWDTCLMVLFARYAPKVFPAVESLNNFYVPLHDGKPSPLGIKHCDNPPLFAWCEEAALRLSGDLDRISCLIRDQGYLQKHYHYFNALTPGCDPPQGLSPVTLERTPKGYHWGGNQSGMDNTPRGRDDYRSILWVDALAQQGLAAAAIARLARAVDDHRTAAEFEAEIEPVRTLLDRYYWNSESGFYFDIEAAPPHRPVKVMTPASYWPLLAGLAGPEQARAMCRHAIDPETFGGSAPWPSVARHDPDFEPSGRYWRGGIWLPTAYMAIKGLENYGFHEEAGLLSERLLAHMHQTWQEFSPHTIWEAYSPREAVPSDGKIAGQRVRPDFCGWSALGPVALLLENVLGFHTIDGVTGKIVWHRRQTCRHGVRNLRFGDINTDIIWDHGTLTVASSRPYELTVNRTVYSVAAGEQSWTVD